MDMKIEEVTKGVHRVVGTDSLYFSPGIYDILFKKDGCEDVTAKLMVTAAGITELFDVTGGELVIDGSVIKCDMECSNDSN